MRSVLWMTLTGMVACGIGTGPSGELKAAEFNGTWTLVEINSKPVASDAQSGLPSFTIKDQSIEGFDGCNTFSGQLDRPGSITSTRRGCPEDAVKLPLDLRDPMAHLKEGRIEKDMLRLPARDPIPASVFKRVR
jgi:heat shock protein HslJ